MLMASNRQRVIQHGEVFTPPELVTDMLDLVAHECERIDSRFLEPACGDGNFLAEVLRRRLKTVDRKCGRSMIRWEQDALLGLACLYGIELLYDNVNTCRDRLHAIFQETYSTRFRGKCRSACSDAARVIVRCNIQQGDALKMTTVGDRAHEPRPLTIIEWSMLSGGIFKRHEFEYQQLPRPDPRERADLFDQGGDMGTNDLGASVFIVKSIRQRPLVHYLSLAKEGGREARRGTAN